MWWWSAIRRVGAQAKLERVRFEVGAGRHYGILGAGKRIGRRGRQFPAMDALPVLATRPDLQIEDTRERRFSTLASTCATPLLKDAPGCGRRLSARSIAH